MTHQSPLAAANSFRKKFFSTPAWITSLGLVLLASPAMAHHAMEGKTPSTFETGFLSGLAHPVIGPDHFAFVVALGLLAALKSQGFGIPIAFLVSAMLGTALHVTGAEIPGVELLVSGSILVFGILLVLKNSPPTPAIVGLASLAGIFHGYAYGESIFGAETTPLLAYLLGFTVIQVAIAASAFGISRRLLQTSKKLQLPSNFRSAGFVLCGVGAAFLAAQIGDLLFAISAP